MEIPITKELISICSQIVEKGFSLDQWAEIESDDMFQNKTFCGGFDADENEFCFSYFDENGQEYWFQFNLSDANEVVKGNRPLFSGSVPQ